VVKGRGSEGKGRDVHKEISSEFHLDRCIMSPLCGENLPQCHYFDEKLSFGDLCADHGRMFFTRQIVGM